jgi:UDP-N-acetylglucosamine 2-epimerase (non-hydrolysing)
VERFGVDFGPSVRLTAPLGYMDFLNLWKDAAIVLTDSGGLQEETTALGIPCLTLRENTERPITVAEGTNIIVGRKHTLILEETKKILTGHGKVGKRPDLWDGRAAERIVDTLARLMA